MSDRRSSMGASSDDPPNSRLFIIGPKNLNEDDFRKVFDEFGHIEEIWLVKDRQTGDYKGITYIKYSKTSEAARALEAMDGKQMAGTGRSIKVKIAASRDQGSKRDLNEDEKMQRLFLVVPRSMTDKELLDDFKQFGDVDYASIIRDRTTKESKGVAYVKYNKFSHAAAAFEQCDKKYRAVFAEPKKPREERERNSVSANSSFDNSSFSLKSSSSGLLQVPPQFGNDGYSRLSVIASPTVNQDQLWKLFDVVPTMEYCQLRYEGERNRPSRAIAEVAYSSAQWASYAKEKLHGFEYPPSYRLIVRPEYDGNIRGGNSTSRSMDKPKPDILKIAETIAQASSLIEAAGLSPDVLQAKLGLVKAKENEVYCSARLPDPQPLASIDDETVARCFIVCTPSALPNSVLKDIFCRFGTLIDVYMLNNRNCGYAKYASKEAAEEAIQVLHGAEVLGTRLKVLEAEERPEKRQKLEVDSPYDAWTHK